MNSLTDRVKLVCAVLAVDRGLLVDVTSKLSRCFGEVDFISSWCPFEHTSYYESEMGVGLSRCFISFRKLIAPEKLVEVKLTTAGVEDEFRLEGKRRVNLDPGYIDYCKFVLASFKCGGHKVALGKGVYADMLLRFEKGVWHPFPWTFPDFKAGLYDESLAGIRALFKEQIRQESRV